MTDIVERLREGEDGLEYAAADEIERLRAALLKAEMQAEIADIEEVGRLVAIGRREGIEAALAAARSVVSPCDDMQRHVAADEIVAAIRALLEDKP